ncbi:MAG: aminopeptidase P family protein, partial [Desulfobacterales bacterium]|nr:aminopeptidase P family protein [Desulfobacterales bacterium]
METSHRHTPLSELRARCEKLKQHLQQNDIPGALILQNADLFYFSGTAQQANLYIQAQGKPLLMVRKDFERARAESALERVVSFSSPKEIPGILHDYGISTPQKLGMELDVVPANLYFTYARLFKKSEITDISTQIRMIRAVKSAHEIQKIREAAAFSDQLAAAVPGFLHEGIPEVELAGRIEAEARRLGHQGIVRMRMWGAELFYGHVMAGSAAAVPSYLASPTGGAGMSPAVAQGASMRRVRRHEPVLVDMVFAADGYNSDHARIYALGDLPDDLIDAHNAMRSIQEAIKKAARPGAAAGDLFDLALDMAAEHGLADYFMGTGEQRIQFVGHGIGLELDEFPFLAKGQKMPLEPGMIIALEPKVIIPDRGVVGIENTH